MLPHLLHTNKYATFWDNPGVITMINCQVIWLTINLFIWQVSPSANNCQFIPASIIIILWDDLWNAHWVVLLHTFHSHFIIISEASVGTWHEMDAFVLFHTELNIYYWSLKSQLSCRKDSVIGPISDDLHALVESLVGFSHRKFVISFKPTVIEEKEIP